MAGMLANAIANKGSANTARIVFIGTPAEFNSALGETLWMPRSS
jgi:hypothetical protein